MGLSPSAAAAHALTSSALLLAPSCPPLPGGLAQQAQPPSPARSLGAPSRRGRLAAHLLQRQHQTPFPGTGPLPRAPGRRASPWPLSPAAQGAGRALTDRSAPTGPEDSATAAPRCPTCAQARRHLTTPAHAGVGPLRHPEELEGVRVTGSERVRRPQGQPQGSEGRRLGSHLLSLPEPRARKYKCGLPRPCPEEHLAFRMVSGAANVIGPKICLEDKMLMSSVRDNVGRGLNIALVNGSGVQQPWQLAQQLSPLNPGVSGELIAARTFDMWAGDVNDLLKFIRPLHEGTLVFVASYDDPATKMNEETRKLFSDLGSKNVKDLAFRDSWVFVGAKGVHNKSPFEQWFSWYTGGAQADGASGNLWVWGRAASDPARRAEAAPSCPQHVKNSKHTNKYEGWPEALEMEGCIPRRSMAG
ncbi:Protein FAM3A [Galemys pyrenaicus]|uniref:Protein FAM3A n=1 Tax=Galemys pyrenaicus TaxID=202257 RepID=A0A8J6A6M1_GALPY|nr:Protein FAM3A [Galemys pyrenaicus]